MGPGDFAGLVGEGNLSATIQVFDSAIEAAEQQHAAVLAKLAQLHVNRGLCQQRLGLNRKALKDFNLALSFAPTNVAALVRKGQVLHALNKTAEARVALQAAAAHADPTSDMAVVLEIQGSLSALGGGPPSPPPPPHTPAATNGAAANGTALPNGTASVAVGAETGTPATAEAAAAAPAPDGSGAEWQRSAAAPPPPAPQSAANGGAHAPAMREGATEAQPPAHSPPSPRAAAASAPPSSDPPAAAAAPAAAGAAAARPSTSAQGREGAAGAASAFNFAAAAGGARRRSSASAAAAAGAADARAAAVEPAPAGSPPIGGGGAVVEIDCAAQQQQQQQAQRQQQQQQAQQEQQQQRQQPWQPPPSRDSSVAAMENTIMLNLAVQYINAGGDKVREAEQMLDSLLTRSPRELGALVARGTARAMEKNLAGAVEDFTAAIEVEPRFHDSYKRRGQARSALGDLDGALSDLKKAVELLPLFMGATESAAPRAECCVESGVILQRRRNYRAAVAEFARAADLDPSSVQAWNLLGLTRTSMGDIRAGVRAYEKAVALQPDNQEGWVNMGQALKEEGRVREAERALSRALSLDPRGRMAVVALRLLGQMRQGQGLHAKAVAVADKALALQRSEQRIELLYLRAICRHALGAHREAAADYDACIGADAPPESTTEEAKTYQYLSWYQKELALYTRHSLDRPVAEFCPDSELLPLFKESWCKKCFPTAELLAAYRPQPSLPRDSPPPPPPAPLELLTPLTRVADQVGELLQNHHQGFLHNERQQRAAGFAATELAQAVGALLAERRRDSVLWVNSAGSSGQNGCSGRHQFGWRDAMDIVVRWRQLAEPADQVVWVDLLTRREFESGFGSHTPMYSGQTKCVRYYMNCARALELHKQVLMREGHAFDAANKAIPLGSAAVRDALARATTPADVYQAIGTDSWVVVPLESVATPGRQLEGTRLTLVRVPNQPDGYEFSIRTPVTPPRWREFDTELDAAWERLLLAMESGDPPAAARAVLQYCYYWYNFMPLARGTAAVGYTTLLALMWAAGVPVTAPIPKDYQVDWEAILAQHPDQFISRLSLWLLPPAALPNAAGAAAAGTQAPRGGGDGQQAAGLSSPPPLPPPGSLPSVVEVLGSMRRRLEALNGADAPRV